MYIGGLTPISHAHTGGFLDMKDFGYYASLPDSMTIEEVNAEFAELLDGIESKKISNDVFVSSLLELSDRQWHTYSVLNACTKKKIEDCLMSVWNGKDLELVGNIIGIMVRLGLEGINAFLTSCSPKNVSPEVFSEISLALSELGGSVSDPYSGIR
jgi:hypothetical protein